MKLSFNDQKVSEMINNLDVNKDLEIEMKLSFKELEEKILKFDAKSEYKQASIVMLRNIFEDQRLKEGIYENNRL